MAGTLGYVTFSQLLGTNSYFREFGERFYGSNGTFDTNGTVSLGNDINSAYNSINEELRSAGRFSALPVPKDRDGNYPQSLVNWNAFLTIYNKLMAEFAGEREEIPQSISFFGSQAGKFATIVKNGGVIFPEEIDAGELGIGEPQLVGVLGTDTRGTFYNNFQGFPFGNVNWSSFDFSRSQGITRNDLLNAGFLGQDFPRTWVIHVISAGGIGTADFRWSMNSGKNWEGTLQSEEDFQHLDDNVWVRFGPDDLGSNVFSVGDRWKFQTVPKDIRRTYGDQEAVVARALRGF